MLNLKSVKRLFHLLCVFSLFTSSFLMIATPKPVSASVNLVQYVDPRYASNKDIGMSGSEPYYGQYGQANPAARVPFGMSSWGPMTRIDNNINYLYQDTTLLGFPAANVQWHHAVTFLPYAGAVTTSPGTNSYSTTIDHNANESSAPGYYHASTGSAITVDLTSTARAGYGQFTFTTGSTGSIIMTANNSISIDVGNHAVSGVDDYGYYFYAKFDRAFTSYATWNGSTLTASSTSSTGSKSGAVLSFDTSSTRTVQIQNGLSFVSASKAQSNLNSEIIAPALSFSTVKANASDAWNTVLNKIVITDPNANTSDLAIFYSAMYRLLIYPSLVSDADKQYKGWDGTIRTVASGHSDEYSNISGWDAGHGGGQFELFALLFQNKTNDFMQSWVDAHNQADGGFAKQMADGPYSLNNNGNVHGDYSIPPGAYAFGATNFDTTTALAMLYKNATVSGLRSGLSYYLTNGWVPSNQGIEANVENTLSYSIADFATAQMANAVGDTAKYNDLMNRTDYWKNTFNTSYTDNGYAGYAWGRQSNGTWDSFSNSSFGGGDKYFQEASSAQESWWVPHNIAGLVATLGGNTTVNARLDRFFTNLNAGYASSYAYMGNEVNFPTPWIYNWTGAPSKAQDVVRRTQLGLYAAAANGTPGNTDWGAMDAWYVWATLGLYPEIPGVAGLAINSPLFAQATLTMDNGKTIVINGTNASRANKYVQSVTLNGSSYGSPWIPLSSLSNGSSTNTLTFTLGSSSSSWGSSPTTNIPPSYSAIITSPTPAPSTNLALNKTATSNGASCGSNQTPAQAVDGNRTTTKWCQGGSGGQTLTIDLGSSQSISQVGLYFAGSGGEDPTWNMRDYNLQISTDNSNWTTVYTMSANTANSNTDNFSAVPARYVRLNVVTAQTNTNNVAVRLYEMEIYGPQAPANLVENSGFENGTTSWVAQASTIATDSANAHSGVNSVKETGRTAVYGAAAQNILSALQANGQGSYSASAWAKMASASGTGFVIVNVTDSGSGNHWFRTSSTSIGTSYGQLSGALNITWSGTLTAASIYVQTDSSLADLYVDDFSLTKP